MHIFKLFRVCSLESKSEEFLEYPCSFEAVMTTKKERVYFVHSCACSLLCLIIELLLVLSTPNSNYGVERTYCANQGSVVPVIILPLIVTVSQLKTDHGKVKPNGNKICFPGCKTYFLGL